MRYLVSLSEQLKQSIFMTNMIRCHITINRHPFASTSHSNERILSWEWLVYLRLHGKLCLLFSVVYPKWRSWWMFAGGWWVILKPVLQNFQLTQRNKAISTYIYTEMRYCWLGRIKKYFRFKISEAKGKFSLVLLSLAFQCFISYDNCLQILLIFQKQVILRIEPSTLLLRCG